MRSELLIAVAERSIHCRFNEGPSDNVEACPAYGQCNDYARARDPTRFTTWADDKDIRGKCYEHATLISFNNCTFPCRFLPQTPTACKHALSFLYRAQCADWDLHMQTQDGTTRRATRTHRTRRGQMPPPPSAQGKPTALQGNRLSSRRRGPVESLSGAITQRM